MQIKEKRTRTPKIKYQIYLNQLDSDAVEAEASRTGSSPSEVIRLIVARYFESRQVKVA